MSPSYRDDMHRFFFHTTRGVGNTLFLLNAYSNYHFLSHVPGVGLEDFYLSHLTSLMTL